METSTGKGGEESGLPREHIRSALELPKIQAPIETRTYMQALATVRTAGNVNALSAMSLYATCACGKKIIIKKRKEKVQPK